MIVKMVQLEPDQSIVNCGMSYIFMLGNNSFFIVDGGYFTPGESERLYSILKENSNQKPTIKGWLFTHAHQDHIGCFMDFVLSHINDIEIEKLLFNFQPIDLEKANGNPRQKSNDIATVKEFYDILESHCKHIQIVKLHAGDRIEIDKLTIDVLYTCDEILPLEVSFNDYSAVTKISIENQSILFLGDIQENGSKWLIENKKSELKSDFLQVSHHGFNGATKELYESIDFKTALFPCPDYEFENKKNSIVNSYILDKAKEYYVSGYGSQEFEFPYKINTAKQNKKQFSEQNCIQ